MPRGGGGGGGGIRPVARLSERGHLTDVRERRKGGGVFWGTEFWETGVEPGTQYTEKVICSGGHG